MTVNPLDLAAADPAHTYEPFPAHVTGGNDNVSLGTLNGGETKHATRHVQVTADGHLKLTTLVTSDGAPARARASCRPASRRCSR